MSIPDNLEQLLSEASALLEQGYCDEQIVFHKKLPAYTRMFSPLRANVIKWIPIQSTDAVLEIGADFGEITGYLCTCSKTVLAYERNPDKAELIRKRHREYGNLRILTGDLQGCMSQAQEDGVRFVVIHNPQADFADRASLMRTMEQVRACLPDAVVIFACSNLFGLKYLAGACPQGGKSYESLYAEDDGLYFTRRQLEDLFSGLDYRGLRFFYPYPDEVFAKAIFSDSFLPETEMLEPYACRWDDRYVRSFDERNVFRAFQRHQLFTMVSNAFVVVASAAEANLPQLPRLIRFSNDRAHTLSIRTLVMGDRVIKRPDNPAANGHLHRTWTIGKMLECQYRGTELNVVACEEEGCALVCRYVEGEGLRRSFREHYNREDHEAFSALLRRYIAQVRQSHDNGYFSVSPEFTEVFGSVSLPDDLRCGTCNNVDIIFDNIIVDAQGKWHVIDYEWSFCFPIPVQYIIFRAIFDFFMKLPKGERQEAWMKRSFEEAGITDALYEQLLAMERGFQRYVARNHILLRMLPLV